MSKFRVIAFDIYKKNIKSVSFLIMILLPFIIVGIAYVATMFASDEATKIAIVSNNPVASAQMEAMTSEDYIFTVVDSEEAAQNELKNEDVDAYLVVDNSGDTISGTIYSDSSMGTTTQMLLQQYLTVIQSSNRAQALGLTPEQVMSLNESASFNRQSISFEEDGSVKMGEDNSSVRMIVSYGSTILLFMIILTYAQIIAQEIASEKGTRIMEVILSSTTAKTHFYGKIVGVLLVALTQLVIYGVVAAVSIPFFSKMDVVQEFLETISLGEIFGPFLIFTIVYVILGILIYSVLSALCGSLVNKAEDTAKAILPVTYLSLGGYMLGLVMGIADPSNVIVRVTSYIPFLSSYIMPVRLAYDTAEISSAVISVVILAVTTVALMLISAKMYKSNVLVYSEGGILASLKQSISIMRNERKK